MATVTSGKDLTVIVLDRTETEALAELLDWSHDDELHELKEALA